MINCQYEYDYYITPDGEMLNLNDYNTTYLMSSQGNGMATINYQTQVGPFQHGSSPLTYLLQPRTISMVLVRKAVDREDYWTQRELLLNYFRPNRQTVAGTIECGKLRKILPNGETRDLDVLVQSGLGLNVDFTGAYLENRITEGVQFIAFDPTFYDPNEATVIATVSSLEDLIFPITFPITFGSSVIYDTFNVNYSGSWMAYPIVEATGPLTSFNIENLSTGESVGINYSIGVGETVTIDMRTGYKTVVSSDGSNLIGTLSTNSDISTFHIAPSPEAAGGVNQLRISGGGASSTEGTNILLRYFTRYIGI